MHVGCLSYAERKLPNQLSQSRYVVVMDENKIGPDSILLGFCGGRHLDLLTSRAHRARSAKASAQRESEREAQELDVVRTGVYYHQTGNEKRTTFRKSSRHQIRALEVRLDEQVIVPRQSVLCTAMGRMSGCAGKQAAF